MVADDFDDDIDKLLVKGPPPPLPDSVPIQSRRQNREHSFVQISRGQLAILRKGHASGAAWNVFVELAWLSWKANGKPFKFSNHHLDELNLSHDSRARAIRELGKLGLIKVEGRAKIGKSPSITLYQT